MTRSDLIAKLRALAADLSLRPGYCAWAPELIETADALASMERELTEAEGAREGAHILADQWKTRAETAEQALAEAIGAIEPFGRAVELIEEGLSVAISRDDGNILVDDADFRRARAFISNHGRGADDR